jgi:2'-5' RNA ligase
MTEQQLYVAVLPPPEIIDAIGELPTRAQRGVRYTKRDQWHITVKFLGASDPDAAVKALADMEAPAVEATLGPAVSLLGARVLMIPVSGLDDLAAASSAAFAGVGESQPDREFSGHLTLARLKGAPLRDPSVVPVLGVPISATFRASSVVLVKTEMTTDGTSRTVIGEKTLAE